ncbi:MAG: methyltransferase domain-containing protein [Solirubrobacterales bacterium]|nr:methyltransferase domain-containing protein [Solirubrobacterales bacterium]
MDSREIFLDLIDRERNVYEPAHLHEQRRRNVSEYVSYLRSPEADRSELDHRGGALVSRSSGKRYPVQADVVNFLDDGGSGDPEWERLNQSFLRYHRSLTTYTLLNSAPVINFVSEQSGIGELRDSRVVDVGGGTGHTLCSFFRHPETIEYYLVDPNLRLLHDQFIRFYPRLAELRMGHVLAHAEGLPFQDRFADVVVSLSSIDHFSDHRAFAREAARVLKSEGRVLVSSHLDIPAQGGQGGGRRDKVLSRSFPERVARYLYYRRHRVGSDDHTLHLKDTSTIEQALEAAGLRIDEVQVFKRYFFIVATKP